jgi:hypothetical protein
LVKAVSLDRSRQSEEVEITVRTDHTTDPNHNFQVGDLREVRGRTDLVLDRPYGEFLGEATTTTTTTTTSTTTTTEKPKVGLDLYLLPGICINLSFNLIPVAGCTE